MPDLEVTIFNEKVRLSYQENEKHRLINAVKMLNKKWNKFSDLHAKVSNLKIITLISLELQDTIEDMQSLKEKINKSNISFDLLKKEIEIKNKELENSSENIKKLESDLDKKNEDIYNTEIILDEINDELLQIKKNFLNK